MSTTGLWTRVVEGAIIGDRAHPGEVGLIQMLIHFGGGAKGGGGIGGGEKGR